MCIRRKFRRVPPTFELEMNRSFWRHYSYNTSIRLAKPSPACTV